MPVLSGSANAGAPFDVRADRPAAESAYAALVRLVEQAQAQRAPFVRMADRYAGFFLPATLMRRRRSRGRSAATRCAALAVVVVATPCPLILAAPIALVSGLSRAAPLGVIVKGAGAIETLGEARTVLFDKTGTLTVGTPRGSRHRHARQIANAGELLRAGRVGRPACPLTCSARRSSAPRHEAGLALATPANVHEEPGQGISRHGRRPHGGGRQPSFMRAAGVHDDEIAAAGACCPATAPARRTCSSASTATWRA